VSVFFLFRVDAKDDAMLPPPSSHLRGRVGDHQRPPRVRLVPRPLEGQTGPGDLGARPQRPLWAGTGTKDPAYSDILYVEEPIAPGVINTMPEATLRAYADHGDATRARASYDVPAEQTLREAKHAGIDLTAITGELEREGVRTFCESYHQLLERIETKLRRLVRTG
jgi:transaldolase